MNYLWAQTMHVIQDTKDCGDSPVSTYPLIIGPKEADHRPLLSIMFKDLQNIRRNPFFSYTGRGHAAFLFVLSVFAILGDQPERRFINFLMAGNSTYHCRW